MATLLRLTFETVLLGDSPKDSEHKLPCRCRSIDCLFLTDELHTFFRQILYQIQKISRVAGKAADGLYNDGTLLNIDGKGPAHTESAVAKSTRPSVLDHLKRPVPPRSTDKKPKQHEEVR